MNSRPTKSLFLWVPSHSKAQIMDSDEDNSTGGSFRKVPFESVLSEYNEVLGAGNVDTVCAHAINGMLVDSDIFCFVGL